MITEAIEYLPEEYLDEYPPPGKENINDWILATDDGLFFLKPPPHDDGDDATQEWTGRQLYNGDTITFTWCVSHGRAVVRWDGSTAAADAHMPAAATHVCVMGDSDTLAHSWQDFEENLSDLGYDAGEFDVHYYSWPSAKYRFDAGRREFLAVAEEAA